jgi:Holliday junction resolvase RusA-like endonuclease
VSIEQLALFDSGAQSTPRADSRRSVTRTERIDVRGTPRPQGSIQAIKRKDGGIATKYASTVWAWRHQVQHAVAAHDGEQFTEAVEVQLGFDLLRPQSHFLPVNSKRSTPGVRPSAPCWPLVAPDLDKLVRCVCDAITDAGLWHDDAQVVSIRAAKRYVSDRPGVLITVKALS